MLSCWQDPSPIGEAAGVIHTDFEKGFIKADRSRFAHTFECSGTVAGPGEAATVSYDDFVQCGSEEDTAPTGNRTVIQRHASHARPQKIRANFALKEKSTW